jgi:hypothetical protein
MNDSKARTRTVSHDLSPVLDRYEDQDVRLEEPQLFLVSSEQLGSETLVWGW